MPKREHNKGDLVGPNRVKFLYWTGEKQDGKRVMAGECPYEGCHEVVYSIESRINSGAIGGYCEKHSRIVAKEKGSKTRRKMRCIEGQPVASDKNAPILLQYIINAGEETKGLYLCQQCKTNTFIRTESHILLEHSWFCPECTAKNRIKHNTDYHVGDIVNQDYNILWLSEDEKRTGKNNEKRQGWFKNLNSGVCFHTTLLNVLSGNSVYSIDGCSKPIQKIKYFLDTLNIKYVTEKSFVDLVSPKGRKLRYDIYLPELNTLIEYDGEQHFYQRNFSRTKEEFEYLQKCDELKNQYAKQNSIKLIRYSYFDYTARKITLENLQTQLYDKEILNG